MTPELAADLAARTKAAIDRAMQRKPYLTTSERADADRERVDSDLRLHGMAYGRREDEMWAKVLLLADAGLVRTAALYGITP